MILETVCSGPLGTNGYLIGCSQTKKAAIIDAPPGSGPRFLSLIAEHQLKLVYLLLTHSHWDHIADVAFLKEKTEAAVYLHQADAYNLLDPGADGIPLYTPISAASFEGYLEEGKTLSLGKLSMEVIHTPGHAPGCICLYLPAFKTLFSGDTLFQGGMGNLSLPTGQPALMRASLAKLKKLPGETVVYPGHGDPTTIEAERGRALS